MAIALRRAPILLLHITSSITNKCHPFHCSAIPTSNQGDTTKHDTRAINNMLGSLCIVKLTIEIRFHSLHYHRRTHFTSQDKHIMAIYRTTPMIMSFKSTLPPNNNGTTTIVGYWWCRVIVEWLEVRLGGIGAHLSPKKAVVMTPHCVWIDRSRIFNDFLRLLDFDELMFEG